MAHLDDLSYVRRDHAETSVLFELIAERYEHKSWAITANTPFSQWGEVLVEPAMTLPAVDRLVKIVDAGQGAEAVAGDVRAVSSLTNVNDGITIHVSVIPEYRHGRSNHVDQQGPSDCPS